MDVQPTQIVLDGMRVGDILYVGCVGCRTNDQRAISPKLTIMKVPHGWNYNYTVTSQYGCSTNTIFVSSTKP